MLQDVVVPVGVRAQVRHPAAAPVYAGCCQQSSAACACQAVYGGIRQGVVQPLPPVDAGISRFFARDAGKRPDGFPLSVLADVAIPVGNVVQYGGGFGIAVGPLLQVSAFPHDAFSLFKKFHQGVQVFVLCFSDAGHRFIGAFIGGCSACLACKDSVFSFFIPVSCSCPLFLSMPGRAGIPFLYSAPPVHEESLQNLYLPPPYLLLTWSLSAPFVGFRYGKEK